MKRNAIRTGIVLAAVAVVGGILPYVTTPYYVSLASLVLIAALLAASINRLAGQGGLLSIGHAGISASAGYGVAWATVHGFPLWAQLGLALGLTLVVSLIYGLMSMRTSGIFFLMVTLALGMIIFGLAYRLAPITGGENGLSGVRRPEGIGDYWVFHFLVLAIFVVSTIVLWIVSRSPFGLTLRGIKDSESRMVSLGYRVPRIKLGGMMISGFFAGLAGVLAVWQTQFISPSSAGFHKSAIAVIIVILGGVGTTFGPLIGAAIVVWIEHVLSTSVERWPTVLGLVFILVIVFAPAGLAGTARRVRSWAQARRGRGPLGVPDALEAEPAPHETLESGQRDPAH